MIWLNDSDHCQLVAFSHTKFRLLFKQGGDFVDLEYNIYLILSQNEILLFKWVHAAYIGQHLKVAHKQKLFLLVHKGRGGGGGVVVTYPPPTPLLVPKGGVVVTYYPNFAPKLFS